MTRAGAIKLGILVLLIFILCLPEFFPQVPQIHFLCEAVDPCTPEEVLIDVHVFGTANPPCTTEMRNSSSQERPPGWYLCKTEMDGHVLHNNTLVSGEHVMVVLTLKADNHSEWNITLFINHTDLYTGPQNLQRLFYCYLPPNRSKCPDMNTKENNPARPSVSTLKNTTSAKPVTSSFKIEMSSTQKLNCQLPSSGYLFHYPENNQTARSAAFPRTPTRNQSWWSVTTGVWIILVLTLVIVIVASTRAGCLVKDRRVYHRKSNLLTVSARDCQLKELKELSERRGNLTRSAPDAFAFGVDELSPIYEITENSLDEDCDDGEEEEKPNTKQAHLHPRSNPSCSCHATDGELYPFNTKRNFTKRETIFISA